MSASNSTDQTEPVRSYHELSKHHPNRFAPGPRRLDWANQPDPFRRYHGAPLIPLPLVDGVGRLPYEDLYNPPVPPPAPFDVGFVGLFLELALGLSAWKEYGTSRWALRNNPSSGNLHPSEGYLVVLEDTPGSLRPGVYHYAPHEHALECRCPFSTADASKLSAAFGGVPAVVGISSVHWREAWKYGERAFRYCQHDAGHALAALAYAARVLGWQLHLLAGVSDGDIAALLGLDRTSDFEHAEPEEPDFLAALVRPGGQVSGVLMGSLAAMLQQAEWFGRANRLSPDRVYWPALATVAKATLKRDRNRLRSLAARAPSEPIVGDGMGMVEPASGSPDAVTIIRQRRSAVAMDGRTSLSRNGFLRMMARTMPHPGRVPWAAFPFAPAVFLAIFVHRVEGLEPGLYLLARNPQRLPEFRSACSGQELAWQPVPGSGLPLYALMPGIDLREVAATISCGQSIAGDGAFSVGMIADFDHVLATEGSWSYRRLLWETGLIGQVLYLEAEAFGRRGTGIGCFFDDLMHMLLGFRGDDRRWQSLYHFTVGGALDDRRLRTYAAYRHLDRGPASAAADQGTIHGGGDHRQA